MKIILPPPNFMVRRWAAEMSSRRKKVREEYGDKYENRVGPYRSLIRMQMKKRNCGARDAMMQFRGILSGKKKLTGHTESVLFAACLDVIEGRDGGEKNTA
jgi:hypothetical protein